MQAHLAAGFGLEAAPLPGDGTPLETQLKEAAPIWRSIARKYALAEPDLPRLSSAWHTDADLGRPVEVVTDMSKSRKLGFLEYQPTGGSFFDLFAALRQGRLVP